MRKRRQRKYDDPLCHPDHPRPRTRREFLAQGFIMGTGAVLGTASVTLSNGVQAQLSPDLLPDVELARPSVTWASPHRLQVSSAAGTGCVVDQQKLDEHTVERVLLGD